MKFDVFAWNEEPSHEIKVSKGRLQLRVSSESALYIESEGYEVLYGVGTTFDLRLSSSAIAKVIGPKGVRVFRHVEDDTSVKVVSENFTNPERMVQESGALLEVKRALRELELKRRSVLSELSAAAAADRAEREALKPGKVEKETETASPPPATDQGVNE